MAEPQWWGRTRQVRAQGAQPGPGPSVCEGLLPRDPSPSAFKRPPHCSLPPKHDLLYGGPFLSTSSPGLNEEPGPGLTLLPACGEGKSSKHGQIQFLTRPPSGGSAGTPRPAGQMSGSPNPRPPGAAASWVGLQVERTLLTPGEWSKEQTLTTLLPGLALLRAGTVTEVTAESWCVAPLSAALLEEQKPRRSTSAPLWAVGGATAHAHREPLRWHQEGARPGVPGH